LPYPKILNDNSRRTIKAIGIKTKTILNQNGGFLAGLSESDLFIEPDLLCSLLILFLFTLNNISPDRYLFYNGKI